MTDIEKKEEIIKTITPYLDHLKYEKKYSTHTVLNYQEDLVEYFFISIENILIIKILDMKI